MSSAAQLVLSTHRCCSLPGISAVDMAPVARMLGNCSRCYANLVIKPYAECLLKQTRLVSRAKHARSSVAMS